MANVQRLTKRVKDLEEWIKENEMMGGPQGVLEVFTYLVNEARGNAQRTMQAEQTFNHLRGLTFEFVQQHELTGEWDEFVKEKENAVQEQATEEVPTREASEDSEEVGEEDSEGSETSKEDSEKKD